MCVFNDGTYIIFLKKHIDAVKQFAESFEGFEELALTFKRVKNILEKAERSYGVDPDLFRAKCESELWNLYQECEASIEEAVARGDYDKAFSILNRFRDPVDLFFDEVEILTKESERLRENRLALLQAIERLFLKVADFSKFSV